MNRIQQTIVNDSHSFLTSEVFAGLIPCAFLLIGLFFIPESPRWLVRKKANTKSKNEGKKKEEILLFTSISTALRTQAKTGRRKDFIASLQKLRGKDADISNEAEEIQVRFFDTSNFGLF